jgi:hypothetical protein
MAMKKLPFIVSVLVAVALVAVVYGCSTAKPPPTSAFQDDWTGLFLTVTKSFGVTHSYYLGSDDRWSYFKTTGELLFTPTYRKVETSRMKLSRTFSFCQGKPYRIQLSDFGYGQNRAPNTAPEPTATATSVSTNK